MYSHCFLGFMIGVIVCLLAAWYYKYRCEKMRHTPIVSNLPPPPIRRSTISKDLAKAIAIKAFAESLGKEDNVKLFLDTLIKDIDEAI